ncbi:LacI family DNA-binding transcriptional regulator [Streptomyces sp. LZ34]
MNEQASARRGASSPLGVRMEDVAKLAQVSRATVSRVLQGSPPVSEKTREKVYRAIRELGYVPNKMAQQLANSSSDLVGLLLRDPRNPAYGLLHSEIQGFAAHAGLQLITAVPSRTEGAEQELDALRRMLGLRVGGLFVATGVVKAPDLEPFLDSVPVVSVGRVEDHPRIQGVSYDEDTHGAILADRVASAGHRSVAVVTPTPAVSTAENRRGTAMAAHLAGRGVRVHRLAAERFSAADDRCEDIVRLVSEGRVTAAMFPNDMRALTFLDHAERAGIRAPEDLSVTGCDGIIPGIRRTGLATLQIPVRTVAERATAVMARLMKGPHQHPVQHEAVTGHFMPGRTLAPPPGG